jgi:hypothetical protein
MQYPSVATFRTAIHGLTFHNSRFERTSPKAFAGFFAMSL